MQGLDYNCRPVVALWNAAVFCYLMAKANHGIKHWRIFFVTFSFNLTLAFLLHLSETLPHTYFSYWSFDSLLPSPSSSYLPFLLLCLPCTFPFCSHSLFDHLCFLPIIFSISSFTLSHIFFSPRFCLSLIFVLVINHPPHTKLANSSHLSFSLLP